MADTVSTKRDSRADRFGWPPGEYLNCYDEKGRRISRDEWLVRVRRDARKKKMRKTGL